MSLRKKTFLLVCLALAFMLGGLHYYSRNVVASGFAALETREATINLNRVRDKILSEVDNLEVKMADWAAWDDAWRYVADGNRDFEKSNLAAATIGIMKIHLLSFWRSDRALVFGRRIELDQNGNKYPMSELSPPDYEFLKRENWFHESRGPKDVKKGLVMLSDGPYVLTSHPIVNSEGEGPIRGAIISARKMDDRFFARLSEVTHVDVRPFGLDDEEIAGDRLVGQADYIVPLSTERLGAYTSLRDAFGETLLKLRLHMPRDIHAQGRKSIVAFLASASLVGLVMIGLIMALLEGFVLSRLSYFAETVEGIEKGAREGRDRQGTKLPVEGRDELAFLAGAVNRMLDSLDESQARFRRLMDNTGQGFLTLDREGRIGPDVSRAVGQFLDDATGGRAFSELIGGDPAVWRDYLATLFSEPMEFSDLCALCPATIEFGGRTLKTEYHEIKDTAGKRARVLVVLTDVSALRRLEAETARAQRRRAALVQVFLHRRDFEDLCLSAEGLEALRLRPDEFARQLHTLKGGFAYLACGELVEICHRLEERTDLAEVARELRGALDAFRAEFLEFFGDAAGAGDIRGDRGLLAVDRERLERWIETLPGGDPREALRLSGLLQRPLREALAPLEVSLRAEAHRTGKEMSGVEWREGGDLEIIPELYAPLLASFVHISRNVIAHGIDAGRLTMRAREVSGCFELRFEDDGRGAAAALLAEGSLERIFEPGFSTRGEGVSALAGRGVGLHVVRTEARRYGGEASAYSVAGGGFGVLVRFRKLGLRDWFAYVTAGRSDQVRDAA